MKASEHNALFGMKTIAAKIPVEEWHTLNREARRRGCALGAIVREAIQAWCEERNRIRVDGGGVSRVE
jgi:hypothetical protein